MIQVVLPAQLRALGRIDGSLEFALDGPATQRTLLDALERRHPALTGAIRDRHTGERRVLIRFFGCGRDLSHETPDAALPPEVVDGREPFVIVAAIAGG